MTNDLKDCKNFAQNVILNPEAYDISVATEKLSRWIGYFQHERLIHLIVTALFAVLVFITLGLVLLTEKIELLIIFFVLLVVTIFYVGHYYRLENTTQLLYKYMDKFIEIKNSTKEIKL